MQQLRAQDESLKRETARWLNALLLRMWCVVLLWLPFRA